MCVCVCVYTTVPVEVRGQFEGVGSLLMWVLELRLSRSLTSDYFLSHFSSYLCIILVSRINLHLNISQEVKELIKLYSIYVELFRTFDVVSIARYFN